MSAIVRYTKVYALCPECGAGMKVTGRTILVCEHGGTGPEHECPCCGHVEVLEREYPYREAEPTPTPKPAPGL